MIPEIEEDDPGIYFCILNSQGRKIDFSLCVWAAARQRFAAFSVLVIGSAHRSVRSALD
jgi:hypothetical protein